MKKVYNNINIV